MKLNQRFLTVGVASIVGLGVLAPMASADCGRAHGDKGLAIGLGIASVALLATHHYEAGAIGLGLTAVAAGVCNDHARPAYVPVRYVPVERWRHDSRGRW